MKLKCIMKRAFLSITLFASSTKFAIADNTARSPLNGDITGAGAYYQQQRINAQYAEQQEIQAEILAAENEELAKIYSKDSWRRIGNSTNLARGTGWVEFQGEVQLLTTDGVLFKGQYGPVLTVYPDPEYNEHLVQTLQSDQMRQKKGESVETVKEQVLDNSFEKRRIYGDDLFFVEGFSYPSTHGQGYQEMMALDGDYYSYTNAVTGQVITVHKLIYGTPCTKTWSPGEILAAQQKVESQKSASKQAMENRILKNNQDLADKGDPYGLMRMGERYRDGEGVPKDMIKAKMYFSKAADAGDSTAADELSKLNP